MEELFRIGQVAKIFGVSLDTLRLYEKKGLLIPHVCKENRYRYYSASQLDTVELILNSKNAGMSLDDIAKILKSEDLSFYLDMFKKQEKLLEEKIKILERTKKYTKEKVKAVQQILNFQNDDTLEKEVQHVVEEITLYLMDIAFLIKIGANSPQTEGMETLETWRLFTVTEENEPVEDLETAAFSFQSSGEKSALEKDFLKLYEKRLIIRHTISRNFMQFSFLGSNEELTQYIDRIKTKIPVSKPTVYVKNCHTIINPQKENNYFVEIYIS